VITLPGSAFSYVDTNVVVGYGFEYRVEKAPALGTLGVAGQGYIYAGIQLPTVDFRGKIILLVDDTVAAPLAPELALLQQDLVGDGWGVIRHDVPRNSPPTAIRALISADYATDSANVKAVFLFGHIAVPYSGNFGPDGHPDHGGAWPADVFYGDLDGTWTDSAVTSTSA